MIIQPAAGEASLPNLTPVESNVTTMNINQLQNTEEILDTAQICLVVKLGTV